MPDRLIAKAFAMGLAVLAGAVSPFAASAQLSGSGAPDAGPLMIARQGSFFVGGRDVRSDKLSTLPAYAPEGTITVDQMYVRYQVPATAAPHRPLVFIHGCCLTGKTWETTPDGRMGWDEFFLRAGWDVQGDAMYSEDAIVSAVRGDAYDLIGFTLGADSHLSMLRSVILRIRKASRNRRIVVMIGGPVVLSNPGLVGDVGADATAPDGPRAVALADSLCAERSMPS